MHIGGHYVPRGRRVVGRRRLRDGHSCCQFLCELLHRQHQLGHLQLCDFFVVVQSMSMPAPFYSFDFIINALTHRDNVLKRQKYDYWFKINHNVLLFYKRRIIQMTIDLRH